MKFIVLTLSVFLFKSGINFYKKKIINNNYHYTFIYSFHYFFFFFDCVCGSFLEIPKSTVLQPTKFVQIENLAHTVSLSTYGGATRPPSSIEMKFLS